MATTAYSPIGSSLSTKTVSTPRPISRSRSRAEGRDSSIVSSSPLSQYLEFKKSPGRSSLPEFGSFETTRRRSFKASSSTATYFPPHAGQTTGFAPPPVAPRDNIGDRAVERAADGPSSSGLLSQQLRTVGRNSAGQTPEAALKARLTNNLSNEHVTSFRGSPEWRAAKMRNPVLLNPYVQRAYVMAATAHDGQLRKDGSPVVCHLEQTAIILADLGLDAFAIAAALLHDSLDDSAMTQALLREHMPADIVELVHNVSKVSSISQLFREEQQELQNEATTEQLRTMLLALGDVRVVLIKLADRLHNMRTLSALPAAKRERMALETEAVFVPLANRLGVWSLKAELEDLCLSACSPDGFHELEKRVDDLMKSQKESIETFLSDANFQLQSQRVPVLDMCGRRKNLASIYRKLHSGKGEGKAGARTLNDIHDVRAVRIIVPTKADCYDALRAITARWPEVEGRHKNYIREPKPNGYQSLHTVVISDDGMPFEVQIRTDKMHWIAEFGVAAHWRYKESGTGGGSSIADIQRVMWSRMVLAFSIQLDDKKCRPQGCPARETFLQPIGNHVLTAAAARSNSSKVAMTSGNSMSPLPANSPDGSNASVSNSFHRYASEFAAPPAADEAVSIVVSTPDSATIRPFTSSYATVQDALQWFPIGTRPLDLTVNGERVVHGSQTLRMGDLVQLAPAVSPAIVIPFKLMPRVTPWPALNGSRASNCRTVLTHVMSHILKDDLPLLRSSPLTSAAIHNHA